MTVFMRRAPSLADPVRASAFRAEMTEAGADGRYYCLTPVLIAAWKRIG
jgi:hypothetical protein